MTSRCVDCSASTLKHEMRQHKEASLLLHTVRDKMLNDLTSWRQQDGFHFHAAAFSVSLALVCGRPVSPLGSCFSFTFFMHQVLGRCPLHSELNMFLSWSCLVHDISVGEEVLSRLLKGTFIFSLLMVKKRLQRMPTGVVLSV